MVDSTDLTETELEMEGWERRSILDGPLLEDAVQQYKELGFEVVVREVGPEDLKQIDGCIDCYACSLKVINTRR